MRDEKTANITATDCENPLSAQQSRLALKSNVKTFEVTPVFANNEPLKDGLKKCVSKARKYPYTSNLVNQTTSPPESQQQKKNAKIISIKQLFTAPPKFQKQCKRGIYLSCIIYSEDKLLVTSEEYLPTLEIDDAFPTSLHNDFHWLLKISKTWENVKSFKADIEKCGSASTFQFRLKLLQASAAMQTALGITDLGRLYYKTTRNEDNSVVVISTVNYLRSTKMISSLSVRWIPLAKINNRKSTNNILDILIESVQDQVFFHQVSNMPVGPGLYLGYLMLASSVDVLKILVTGKSPNMVPLTKLRDDPYVSKEESVFLRNLVLNFGDSTCAEPGKNAKEQNMFEGTQNASSSKNETACRSETVVQTYFKDDALNGNFSPAVQNSSKLKYLQSHCLLRGQITTGLKRLFAFLEIDDESSKRHRLYHTGVIEVNSSISLLIVVPPIEKICIPAGQSDVLLKRKDLTALPVPIFELLHMSTYQNEFFSRFSRLSAMMDISTVVAQHHQREAFSTTEMTDARKHLSKLQDLQKRLDTIWKGSRWILDVVTISRDKSVALVSIETLLDTASEPELASPLSEKRSNVHGYSHQSQIRVSNSNIRGEQMISKFDGTSPSFSSISNLSLKPLPVCCTDDEKAAQISSQLVDENPFLFKPGFASIHSSQSQCDVSNFVLSQAHSAERILSSSLHDLCSPGGTYRTNHLTTDGSLSKKNVIPDCVSLPCQYDFYLRFGLHPLPMRSRKSNIPIKTDSICQLDAPNSTNFSVLTQSAVASSLGYTSTSCAHIVNVPATNTFTVAGEFSLSHPSTIIQVYAAYDCGLSEGTSVKIQISNQTTARQVVDLLVKQLNAQVKIKGLQTPVYEQTQEFCLVSVVGARERCLRNDFNPLQLQNPWKSGKMYVRRRRDVTAAIEMNSRE